MQTIKQFRRWLRRRTRKYVSSFSILTTAVVLSLLHLVLFISGLGQQIESIPESWWYRLRGPLPTPEEVIIIGMDRESKDKLDISLNELWPRNLHAQLLEKLAKLEVKRVIFDLYFNEAREASSDAEFAQALTLLPTTIGRYLVETLKQSPNSNAFEIQVEKSNTVESFRKAARSLMLLNLPISHGKVRNFKTGKGTIDDITPLADVIFGSQVTSQELPKKNDHLLYYGPQLTINTIPYHQVLNDSSLVDFSTFRGKTIFIGITSDLNARMLSEDSIYTPVSDRPMHGIEIHATVAANLIRGEWLNKFSKEFEAALLSSLAFFFSYLIFKLNPLRSFILMTTLSLSWFVASYMLFINHYLLPGLLLAALILPLSFIMNTSYYYFRILQSFRQMEEAMGVKLELKK